MSSDEDIKTSRFNAGVALAKRLDDLQTAFNQASYDPLGINPMNGRFGYEIMITSLERLISEGWGKFTDGERKLINRYSEIMKGKKKLFAPININGKGQASLMTKNIDGFMDFLITFERKVKDLLDLHDLNAPSKEDDEGL